MAASKALTPAEKRFLRNMEKFSFAERSKRFSDRTLTRFERLKVRVATRRRKRRS
jgi:hypothetical protein